ncbi:hypothetical protein BG006_004202 [Podila minutissima]|uniref:F-box domain-containing protein n=1 Tax=Podila minutissima TaxID=64525 RepID=A0A9P5VMU7_9FUNG|nr:hypothetical protein BG006_004202 [Podila minutissima]
MADLALHIPHILNSITDSLTFSDLLNCILVCRQWHDRFIAILWTDVVTFRSKPAAMRDTWTYLDYSRTAPGRQALLSHAYAIRALTCQGSNSLQILRASNSINLLEINYLMDSVDSKVSDTGLGDLAMLITVNPRLTAVSIENINLKVDHTREELSRFLDFVDKYSTITSISLNPGLEFDIDTVKYWRVLLELAVEQLVIQGSEPEIAPRWICPLQKLHLHIVYGVEMGYVIPGEDITLKRVRERRSAERVAPSFMAQVGRMTKLSDLKLLLQ